MKHLKWLKFIEWFFRIFSWLMMLGILIFFFGILAVTVAKEIHDKLPITSFYLFSTAVLFGVVLMYLSYRYIWKILHEILNSMEISNYLLQLISRLKYIFLISFIYELFFLITSYMTNNFEALDNLPAGASSAKLDFLFPAIEFFFPSFGEGINTLFFFFIILFIHKFLINYRELKESKDILEEEQKYVV